MASGEQPLSEWEELHGTRHVILQQSVTMLAYMDKSNGSSDQRTESSFWDSIGVAHSRDLPILVGAATGALGLVLIILIAIIIWHCCTRNNAVEKVDNLSRASSVSRPAPLGMVQSDSVVFLGTKPRLETNTTHIGGADNCVINMTRSRSMPLKHSQEGNRVTLPLSEAVQAPPRDDSVQLVPRPPEQRYLETASQSSPYSRPVQYRRENLRTTLDATNELTLKTRSLPSWGRPLSAEDDLGDLYAKATFTKRRKNRMRNDCAAAIAATRSQTPFAPPLPFAHNDTDSLVDNEAVVVYDERTAL
ncbi:uncharacterized protein LOC135367966 isoform X2 [Ornithodoros turicata]|uniref:uncharacterized protein LOC135367966 isoform X2 n=1 Tax=Ornithodoros turicata TaxID=34597 RepID=UPI003139C14C